MTTAVEFTTQGIRFARAAGRVSGRGPRDRVALIAELRAEVERRMPRLAGHYLPRDRAAGYGTCETCSDPMAHYVAGMCDLCVLARGKALGGGP